VATLLTLLDSVGKERVGEGMGEDDDFEAEKVEEIDENVSEEEGKRGGDTGAASSVMTPSIVAPSSLLTDALTKFCTHRNPAKIGSVPAVVAWYVDKRDALGSVLMKEYSVSLASEVAEGAATAAAATEAAAAARLSQLTIDDDSDDD
jgi:hypothetical protein